jgi:hypothetical protein
MRLLGLAVAIALGAAGCGGAAESPDTPAQVKRAFAAEGIRLAVDPYGTSPTDRVTAFETPNGVDDISVVVASDNAASEKFANQAAVLIGQPDGDPDIVRVGNVIVLYYGRRTSTKTKAAAERALERLRE